jgi:hypothetical protein
MMAESRRAQSGAAPGVNQRETAVSSFHHQPHQYNNAYYRLLQVEAECVEPRTGLLVELSMREATLSSYLAAGDTFATVGPAWEYKTLISEAVQLPDETRLNALGAEGWELSGIVPGGDRVTFYFKRQTR